VIDQTNPKPTQAISRREIVRILRKASNYEESFRGKEIVRILRKGSMREIVRILRKGSMAGLFELGTGTRACPPRGDQPRSWEPDKPGTQGMLISR
jgi:hypothetical protein